MTEPDPRITPALAAELIRLAVEATENHRTANDLEDACEGQDACEGEGVEDQRAQVLIDMTRRWASELTHRMVRALDERIEDWLAANEIAARMVRAEVENRGGQDTPGHSAGEALASRCRW